MTRAASKSKCRTPPKVFAVTRPTSQRATKIIKTVVNIFSPLPTVCRYLGVLPGQDRVVGKHRFGATVSLSLEDPVADQTGGSFVTVNFDNDPRDDGRRFLRWFATEPLDDSNCAFLTKFHELPLASIRRGAYWTNV